MAANTALTQQVHELATTIATQTATLDEIHRHVQALAPEAGQFPAPGGGDLAAVLAEAKGTVR